MSPKSLGVLAIGTRIPMDRPESFRESSMPKINRRNRYCHLDLFTNFHQHLMTEHRWRQARLLVIKEVIVSTIMGCVLGISLCVNLFFWPAVAASSQNIVVDVAPSHV